MKQSFKYVFIYFIITKSPESSHLQTDTFIYYIYKINIMYLHMGYFKVKLPLFVHDIAVQLVYSHRMRVHSKLL